MEKTNLTNFQPRALKEFSDAKPSAPLQRAKQIHPVLARDDQDLTGTSDLAAFVRLGILFGSAPGRTAARQVQEVS